MAWHQRRFVRHDHRGVFEQYFDLEIGISRDSASATSVAITSTLSPAAIASPLR